MNHYTRSRNTGRARCRSLALAAAVAAYLPVYIAAAESQDTQATVTTFHISDGDLSTALERFSTQSGVQVLYQAELVANITVRKIHGAYEPSVALTELLRGSGIGFEQVNSRTFVLKRVASTQSPPNRSDKSGKKKPEEDKSRDIGNIDEIVVVGTRLSVNPTDSALPVKIISREEIEQSGASTIAQLLGYLPEVSMNNIGDTNIGPVGGTAGGLEGNEINAATVQMRGLPLGTTLILINGRRSGESSALANSGQFDLNTIPLSMVERIEVLPAGSSALYGGDGLAGVVNIVLRSGGTGLDATVNHRHASGYEEISATALWGKSWARGSLTAMATWKKNSALSNTERSITSNYDFTPYGGSDYRGAAYSYPATVYSLDGCDMSFGFCLLPLELRGNLPGLDSPVAVVPVGQDGQSLTPADFAATQGRVNLSSPEFNIYSPGSSHSISVNGEFSLTRETKLIAELMYTERSISARQLGLGIHNGQYGFSSAVVTAENPFNPFGVDVGIDYWFAGSNIYREYKQEYVRTLVGLTGKQKNWDWEVAAWWSRDRSSTGNHASFASYYYDAVLGATDREGALNPFTGDGSPPGSSELLATLAVPMSTDFGMSSLGVNGFVRGRIAELPAGKMLGLVGVEYTARKLNQVVSVAPPNVSGDDASRAAFAEIRVPLSAARDGDGTFERLVATGATRAESTTRFEKNATTETLGLEFRPIRDLLVRSTYSTAFRPITIHQANLPVGEYSSYVQDPMLDGAYYLVPNIIYGGGVPDGLKPEQSTSTTIGIVYSPTNNARLSVTSWEIKTRDLLYMSPWSELVLEYESSLPGRVVRDPDTGFATRVDTRPFNISAVETAGFDISMDFRQWRGDHLFTSSTAASHVTKHDQKFSPASAVTSNLGLVKSTGWSPRWKLAQRFGWSYRDDAHLAVAGRYVSSYDDPQPLVSGLRAGNTVRLGDFWMFDVNVDLAIGRWLYPATRTLSGARLRLGGTNVFNRLPDFCNSCQSPLGYDASQYDILGRTVYAELKLQL